MALNIQNEPTLTLAFQIWGLFVLESDTEFFRNNQFGISDQIIKKLQLKLCSQLKEQAVGIVDALAPPDEVLGSIFGSSDGDIYNKYLQKIFSSKSTFQRVPWWEQIHNK